MSVRPSRVLSSSLRPKDRGVNNELGTDPDGKQLCYPGAKLTWCPSRLFSSLSHSQGELNDEIEPGRCVSRNNGNNVLDVWDLSICE